jgi:hypothetical protein
MKTFTATVRNGLIRIPEHARIREGAKVLLAVVGDSPEGEALAPSSEIEAEDVEFVRACRGRLAAQMRAEEP